jgi:tRNA dimethylallyltransferase
MDAKPSRITPSRRSWSFRIQTHRSSPPFLAAVMGTTASGKTDLAERLADEFDAELINADAFQVFRGMDIGTSKPPSIGRYHLLDIKNPDENYGVGEFCVLSQTLLDRFWEQGRNVIVVGGTGLYIRALFEEYSGLSGPPPEELRNELSVELSQKGLEAMVEKLKSLSPRSALETDLKNPIRVTRALERVLNPGPILSVSLPPFRRLKFGITLHQTELWKRIESRVHLMVQNGWVREVETLLSNGFGPFDPGFRGIGYSELAQCILERRDLEEAVATTIAETRRYAKRQRTWLRSEPSLISIDSTESDPFRVAIDAIQSCCERE